MLPEENQIAESVYEAKKIICPLGIEVEKIHACKNNYVLFHGDYADLDKCPKCGYDRLRTMCGSRTGGWSLACVMSD
jgi:hypothetical protein